jgi:ABC-type glutathione transport system ATPase component
MASLSLSHINKTYPNGFQAVKDFNLEIEDKEFIIFVGPSGCGKSTTLRMIAGLEEISGGTLKIGDKVMNDVEPKDRDIAMVFQNYALYPHMTVYDNMAFGLKLRKVPKDQKQQESLTLTSFLIVNRRLFPVVRDSELLWDVLSFVILRYSLWMSLFPTWMLSFVYRCVSRSPRSIRDLVLPSSM